MVCNQRDTNRITVEGGAVPISNQILCEGLLRLQRRNFPKPITEYLMEAGFEPDERIAAQILGEFEFSWQMWRNARNLEGMLQVANWIPEVSPDESRETALVFCIEAGGLNGIVDHANRGNRMFRAVLETHREFCEKYDIRVCHECQHYTTEYMLKNHAPDCSTGKIRNLELEAERLMERIVELRGEMDVSQYQKRVREIERELRQLRAKIKSKKQ